MMAAVTLPYLKTPEEPLLGTTPVEKHARRATNDSGATAAPVRERGKHMSRSAGDRHHCSHQESIRRARQSCRASALATIYVAVVVQETKAASAPQCWKLIDTGIRGGHGRGWHARVVTTPSGAPVGTRCRTRSNWDLIVFK